MLSRTPKKLTVIVPVHNEQEMILTFLDRLIPALEGCRSLMGRDADHDVLFVNDGSTDATRNLLEAAARRLPMVKLINLSRNFGKEAALSAGLCFATGDAVVPIDVDLQDPPEAIPEMVAKWLGGAKVVDGVRTSRDSDTWLKRASASGFYRFYNLLADYPIPNNVGDFRLLDREVVEALKEFNEYTRFNKAIYSWVGFERATVEFVREPRSCGTSKWRYWKLWNFALDGIVASTTLPLRIWTYLGATMAICSFLYALFIFFRTIILGVDAPGYASLMTVVLFVSGLNFLSLGVMGEYIGRISKEVRRRPLYIVQSTVGMDEPAKVA
jgi:glycosyltransferase involved in cell wall biosynthesis